MLLMSPTGAGGPIVQAETSARRPDRPLDETLLLGRRRIATTRPNNVLNSSGLSNARNHGHVLSIICSLHLGTPACGDLQCLAVLHLPAALLVRIQYAQCSVLRLSLWASSFLVAREAHAEQTRTSKAGQARIA